MEAGRRMNINRFEELEVWKEGMRLATKIYNVLKNAINNM